MTTHAWKAMGTTAHLTVVADETACDGLLELGVRRVGMLEACWTRFNPSSELCRLNEQAGSWVEVSDDLLALVLEMKTAYDRTGGLFDPTVLSNIRTLGYVADFATTVASDFSTALPNLSPTVGMSGVEVDACMVRLPANVGIDPGAIGKGLAADMVAADLTAAGACSVMVDLGGDIAFMGHGLPDGWRVDVENAAEWIINSERFGVATSTTGKRRWANGTRHHILNPRTGGMADGVIRQATVVAESAVKAETMATAALMLPLEEAVALMTTHSLHGLFLTTDGVREF